MLMMCLQIATPHYNASLLEDMFYVSHAELLHEVFTELPEGVEAVILFKVKCLLSAMFVLSHTCAHVLADWSVLHREKRGTQNIDFLRTSSTFKHVCGTRIHTNYCRYEQHFRSCAQTSTVHIDGCEPTVLSCSRA